MEDMNELRKQLKKWEAAFLLVNGQKPSKEDVEKAPPNIKDCYKRYAKLKSDALAGQKEEEVWGASLHKAKQRKASGEAVCGTEDKTDVGAASGSAFMARLGNKLMTSASTELTDFGSSSKSSCGYGRNISHKNSKAVIPKSDSAHNTLNTDDSEEFTFKSSLFQKAAKAVLKENTPNRKMFKTDVFSAGQNTNINHVNSYKSRLAEKYKHMGSVLQEVDCDIDSMVSQKLQAQHNPDPSFPLSDKITECLKSKSQEEWDSDAFQMEHRENQHPLPGQSKDNHRVAANQIGHVSDQAETSNNCSDETKQCNNERKLSVHYDQIKSNVNCPTYFSDHKTANTSLEEKLSEKFNADRNCSSAGERVHLSEHLSYVSDRNKDIPRNRKEPRGTKRKQEKTTETIDTQQILGIWDMREDEAEPEDEVRVTWQEEDSEEIDEEPKKPVKRQRNTVISSSRGSSSLNENFVRLNMKVRRYKRRGGGMSGSRYKRMEWKKKMAARSESYGDKCFKCGQSGHWANKCPGNSKKKVPVDEALQTVKVDDSAFPSLTEAAQMATGGTLNSKVSIEGMDLPETEAEELAVEAMVVRSHSKEDEVPPPTQPLYQLCEDEQLPDTPAEVYAALRKFGFDSFRAGQEEAVMRILCGESTLVVLSTGAGKSLCYQLPAYMYAKHRNSLTLVISPLVSLMEDQVSNLPPGINGACLHTNMTKAQREKVTAAVSEGKVHFLLMSPEALVGGANSGALLGLSTIPPISFVCIDEAHCVSEWSHHFRPSYLRLCKVLRDKFGVQCMLGLTATATMATAASVAQHLGIKDYQRATIRGNPVPDNLVLSVSRDENKDEALINLLQGERFSKLNSVIVYCTRREQTERLATLIRTCLKDAERLPEEPPKLTKAGKPMKGRKRKFRSAWDAEAYHAGLAAPKRKSVQNAFMAGRLRVVVATVAFGMGLDKSDVRGIIHYNLPKSFESYVQEIGRAGRDGEPAHCHLFLDHRADDMSELKKHIYSNSVEPSVVKRLVRLVFPPCRCRQLQQLCLQADKECGKFDDDGIDYSSLDTASTGERQAEGPGKVCHEVDKLDKASDADSTGQMETSSVTQRICPGHERAIGIDSTVMSLDLKEEGISTLMCYLELHPKRWVENLQPVYSMCTLQCYGGPKQLQAVAKKCPPVAVVIAKEKKQGISHSQCNKLEFPVVDISDSMGWESGLVKRELSRLQWDLSGADGMGPRKSGVMVELSDLAFHFRSPGDLSSSEIDEVTEFLMERITTQEKTELYQLNKLFDTLNSVSHKHYYMCENEVDIKRSDKLKCQIVDYFDRQPDFKNGQISLLSFARELDFRDCSLLDNQTHCEYEDQIRADIRNFISIYSHEHQLNGRVIARIFHGISSPCFPSSTWGRVHRFWRAHMNIDFNYLKKIAIQELVKMK